MIKLFSEDEYKVAKFTDTLPLKCLICEKIFYKVKADIRKAILRKPKFACKYCSNECKRKSQINGQMVECNQCKKIFYKTKRNCRVSPHHFCSSSCSATYNNTHKTKCYRRSKLEVWLEKRLVNEYKDVIFSFNDKIAINSELDIYIESMKLAFELNGIFHYEPIFGQNKLNQIQNNDNRKFQACLEKEIELCVIDSSGLKYFKENKAEPYYQIIKDIIDSKIKK